MEPLFLVIHVSAAFEGDDITADEFTNRKGDEVDVWI